MGFFGGSISSGAKISDCQQYRYSLWRIWASSKPLLVWVMLNPSKANGTENDHTINWCIRYAHQCEFGGILVVNLFAYRATVPADMKKARDPIGPENDAYIIGALKEATATSGQVIVAWGAHGDFKDRDREVLKLIRKNYSHAPLCLEHTNGRQPKHPARLSPRLQLQVYRGRA